MSAMPAPRAYSFGSAAADSHASTSAVAAFPASVTSIVRGLINGAATTTSSAGLKYCNSDSRIGASRTLAGDYLVKSHPDHHSYFVSADSATSIEAFYLEDSYSIYVAVP